MAPLDAIFKRRNLCLRRHTNSSGLPDAYRELRKFDGMREEAAQIVLSTFRSRPWDVLQMALATVGSSFVTRAPGRRIGSVTESQLDDRCSDQPRNLDVRALREQP
jgi:hypothetical protein